jgi:nucleoside-diphosphate-sugar epimerase
MSNAEHDDTRKSVLVTGGAGYVGSILLEALLDAGYKVFCLDHLRFGGESLLHVYGHRNFRFLRCDITNYDSVDEVLRVNKFFAIVHLAAIVGDPACQVEPMLAEKTNWDASVHLLGKAIDLGIRRFVFASTCSNYGKMKNSSQYVDETSELAPVSLYAQLKVKFENLLLNEGGRPDHFCPTSLRFATVYGVSPRMRFDLTVNEFTKELALKRELVVFGQQFWRPYCHVSDFSRAILTVLDSSEEKVSYEVFNVGATEENYTKQMIVDLLLKEIPEARVKYVQKDEDPRDYRVSFEKIKNQLGFDVSKNVLEGIREVLGVVRGGLIQTPDDRRYYNVPSK